VDFRRNQVTISAGGLGHARGFLARGRPEARGAVADSPARIGGIRVQAIIDTGSERTIGNTALRDALKGLRARTAAGVTQVYGATIDVAAGEMEVAPTIDLGSVRITDVTSCMATSHFRGVGDAVAARGNHRHGCLGTSVPSHRFSAFRALPRGTAVCSGALRRPSPACCSRRATVGVTGRGVALANPTSGRSAVATA